MNKDKIAIALESVEGRALLGIDGMIDEVWEVIDRRMGPGEYTMMTKMMDFGTAITGRGTGGLAKERLFKRRASGGFTCNTGRAVATLGLDTTMLGMFGQGNPDPAFGEFAGLSRLVSVGEPARLHILEFADGKIMMPNLDELINLTWDTLVQKLGEAQLLELCNADILGVGYWSNMYDFDTIMTNLVAYCRKGGITKRIFHDFANLNKRTPQALTEALKTLARLNPHMPQTLSLNEHEGGILARQLGIAYPEAANRKDTAEQVLAAAIAIRASTGLDEVIIHTSHYAVLATATQGAATVAQNYCEKPVKTTGAGDTFNGGYMVAALTELPPTQRLTVANMVTLYYVTNGTPPTREQLVEMLRSSTI
ncbi:MAG: PfkB family carbohydrate kinase [Angelakisella sp.]